VKDDWRLSAGRGRAIGGKGLVGVVGNCTVLCDHGKSAGVAVPVGLKVGGGFKCGSEIEGHSEWLARPGEGRSAGRRRAGQACSSGQMVAEFGCGTIGGNPGLGGVGRR